MLEGLFVATVLAITYYSFRGEINKESKVKNLFVVLSSTALAGAVCLMFDVNLTFIFDTLYQVFGNWTKMVIRK